MKLVFEVEVQTYDESDAEVLTTIADTLDKVVGLCELSVGTFVRYNLLPSE